MTEDNEIGTFTELLSAAKWWILGVALVAAVVAGALGSRGSTLNQASIDMRVQFPTATSRAPLPLRFASMAKSKTAVAQAAEAAGLSGQLGAIRQSVSAVVSPDDVRVVQLSVKLKNAEDAKRFIGALAQTARAQAMATVKEQRAAIERSKKLNEDLRAQVKKVVAEGNKVARSLRGGGATTGERLLAEVGIMQTNISALQAQSSLQNLNAQADTDLEAIDNSVVPDGPITVQVLSPTQRVIGYGVRGLIVGLIIALIAIYLPPVRRRLTAR